jgi:hypothetical protein
VNVPSWWAFTLLALAAFRTFRLLAKDTILDPPRAKLLRLAKDWKPGDKIPKEYRGKLAEFMVCPWCLGFWICVVWWIAWQIWDHGTLVAASLMALSAVVGLLAKLDAED